MMIGFILGLLALAGWIYLTFFHAFFWRPVVDATGPEVNVWPPVIVIVPARNEADVIQQSLNSLLNQDYPGEWGIIVVDDHSTDGTAEIARQTAHERNLSGRLTVLAASDEKANWVGKVAAMDTAVERSNTPYILFTDADIIHPRFSLRRIVAQSVTERIDLNSLMVRLSCVSAAEKLMIPAFVYFFGLLFPFRKVNNPSSRVAAAAGGVMLVKRKALENAGGLQAIRNALIDDCALAKLIKNRGGDYQSGGKLRLAVSDDVISIRAYNSLAEIKAMVARTAFTQLQHSTLLLAGTVIGLSILFFIPPLLILFGNTWLGVISWALMSGIYFPTILLYGISPFWVFTLPIAAVMYVTATIDSAFRYSKGVGGQWKGRSQAS